VLVSALAIGRSRTVPPDGAPQRRAAR
jgi:hypothetical protein